MKLVIVSADEGGRSGVESERQLPAGQSAWLWDEPEFAGLEDNLRRIDPDLLLARAEPRGAVRWLYTIFPPRSETAIGEEFGMHASRTVDFDACLAGHVQCVLDTGVVDLFAGDFIIIKAATHEWRNASSDDVAVMLFLIHGAEHPS